VLLRLRCGRSFSNHCDRCLLGRAVPPTRAHCTAVRRREPAAPRICSHASADNIQRTTHSARHVVAEARAPATCLPPSCSHVWPKACGQRLRPKTAGTLLSTTQHATWSNVEHTTCRVHDYEPPHLSDGDGPRVASACAREVLSCRVGRRNGLCAVGGASHPEPGADARGDDACGHPTQPSPCPCACRMARRMRWQPLH
jgi:hypothetical protein